MPAFPPPPCPSKSGIYILVPYGILWAATTFLPDVEVPSAHVDPEWYSEQTAPLNDQTHANVCPFLVVTDWQASPPLAPEPEALAVWSAAIKSGGLQV